MAETEQSAIHVVLTFDDNFWAPAFAVARSICLTTTRQAGRRPAPDPRWTEAGAARRFRGARRRVRLQRPPLRAPRPRRVQRDLPLAAGRSPAAHGDVRAAPARPHPSRRDRRARSISTATRWCSPRSSGCSNGTSRARPSARSAIRCGMVNMLGRDIRQKTGHLREHRRLLQLGRAAHRRCALRRRRRSRRASRSSAAPASSTSSTSTRTCST